MVSEISFHQQVDLLFGVRTWGALLVGALVPEQIYSPWWKRSQESKRYHWLNVSLGFTASNLTPLGWTHIFQVLLPSTYSLCRRFISTTHLMLKLHPDTCAHGSSPFYFYHTTILVHFALISSLNINRLKSFVIIFRGLSFEYYLIKTCLLHNFLLKRIKFNTRETVYLSYTSHTGNFK